MRHELEYHQHHPHRRGGHRHFRRDQHGHGRGRRRARRGAITQSVLALLAERPMHGYELITALEERSGGRWRPSPGSIYPALRKLEQRGLIEATEMDGDDTKQRYQLTDDGHRRVAEAADVGGPDPWERVAETGHGELRRAVSELAGPARQIGRFGTTAQATSAVDTIKHATAELYRILADGPAADGPSDDDPSADDT